MNTSKKPRHLQQLAAMINATDYELFAEIAASNQRSVAAELRLIVLAHIAKQQQAA